MSNKPACPPHKPDGLVIKHAYEDGSGYFWTACCMFCGARIMKCPDDKKWLKMDSGTHKKR